MRWPRGEVDDLSPKRGAKGLRWSIAEGAARWLPAALLDNPEDFLLNNPPQRLLKESPVRTVSIFSGPQGEFLLKHYKTRGAQEWLKYCVVPSKAQKEWVMARLALSKGIPSPLPLAVAERRRAMILHDAFLITQAISPSSPLIELITEGEQKTLLSRTARLIREAHEAGLFHQDLHAGNILVGNEKKQLYLIDLHRSRFVRSLSKQRRLWNLAQFFYSLKGWFSSEDKEAFLQQYDKEKNTFHEGFTQGLQKIGRLEERIYRRHMKSRTKRCLKNSGGFYVVKKEGWRIWARRGWKPEELFAAIQEHKNILVDGKKRLIKDDRRTAITLFDFMKRRVCIKEYRYKEGVLSRLKEIFRRSKARSGWLMGNGLVVRGITGIIPQALLERRKRGLRREAFLIMESPPGYVELDRYMVKAFGTQKHDDTRKNAFLRAVADFMAELYLLKIIHRDLKTCNIMVHEKRDTWDFGLVDMDDIQLDKKISHTKILKTLVQLNTSTPLFIGMRNRIRFLVRYLNLIQRHNVRDIIRSVVRGSKGRELVYVTPQGDVIMDVDWEQSCALAPRVSPAKKEL
jgi:tRNA A-37 threonylcarbamoyl transferase component Bud32